MTEMAATREASSPASGGLYTRLASGLLFPLHERLKHHDSPTWRRNLERSQWLGRDEILAAQANKLRAFLIDIGTRVPYWRERFRQLRFDPAGVRGVSDLASLPLLDKAEIREHTERMKAEGHGALARYNTGGSSGQPLVFYIGKARKSHDVAAKWRATRWWGVDIGDREAVVWGSPIEHGAQDRVKTLRDRVFRSTLLPAFEMSEARLDGFVQWLQRHRPRMLFGYPSALAHIARHAARRGQKLDDLGVEVAFVTSERLYDDQRRDIEGAFACRVANGYGGRDAGFIAHECPHGGMHISAEDIIVETVDPTGRPMTAGQAGEIVVTHLATAEFPFVRYRTGDVGVLDPDRCCSCGRGLPLLTELQGRSTDFVVAADGTVMHGLALIYIVRDLPGVAGFKVVQESLARTKLQLVPGPGFDPDCIARIVAGFRQRLGQAVAVEVELVAEIAPERSGKYRYIVSQVLDRAPEGPCATSS
jgi:phenylacetate-CoA ligase